MPKNRGFTPEQMLLGAVSSIVLVVGVLIGKFLPDGFSRAFCAGAGFSGILFGIGWLMHRPAGPKPYDWPKDLKGEVLVDPKFAESIDMARAAVAQAAVAQALAKQAAAEDLRTARESLVNARAAAERYGKAEEQFRWWSDAHIEDVGLEDDPNINLVAYNLIANGAFERSDPEAEGPWVKLTAMANELELALARGNRPGLYPEFLDDLTKDFNQLMDQEQAWLGVFIKCSPQLRFEMATNLMRNKDTGRHLFRFPDPPADPQPITDGHPPMAPMPA